MTKLGPHPDRVRGRNNEIMYPLFLYALTHSVTGIHMPEYEKQFVLNPFSTVFPTGRNSLRLYKEPSACALCGKHSGRLLIGGIASGELSK